MSLVAVQFHCFRHLLFRQLAEIVCGFSFIDRELTRRLLAFRSVIVVTEWLGVNTEKPCTAHTFIVGIIALAAAVLVLFAISCAKQLLFFSHTSCGWSEHTSNSWHSTVVTSAHEILFCSNNFSFRFYFCDRYKPFSKQRPILKPTNLWRPSESGVEILVFFSAVCV